MGAAARGGGSGATWSRRGGGQLVRRVTSAQGRGSSRSGEAGVQGSSGCGGCVTRLLWALSWVGLRRRGTRQRGELSR